jgi:raffinose/stachyose/melibiose transport system substrate-binding protein
MSGLRRPPFAVLALLVLLALAAGCGTPGEDSDDNEGEAQEAIDTSKKVDVSEAGNVTLTVWDQEVRGGQRKQIETLNAAFERQYPNVTIKRVAKSFEDLNTTLKQAVSDDKPPDVVQANQGRPVMGQLVKAGLLRPLNGYAEAYGWDERYPTVLLDLNRFSANAKQFGEGNLYGLSQMGEIVGVFYNKEKVPELPATFEDFEAALADAKRAGDVPIAFGNLDKWPGIHEFETVEAQYEDKEAIRDFVFARDGASFATEGNEEAAAAIQSWAKRGYFTPDFNGTGYDPAWQDFAKGGPHFLIAGTWLTADLANAMGDNVGFGLMPPPDGTDAPTALGGEGLPFAITTGSEEPDVAAAYIDFLTNANAAEVLTETNNLPAMRTEAEPQGALLQEVFAAWQTLSEEDGLVPYLDYATPTFYDDITAAVQELLGDKVQPKPFVDGLQEDYASFVDGL